MSTAFGYQSFFCSRDILGYSGYFKSYFWRRKLRMTRKAVVKSRYHRRIAPKDYPAKIESIFFWLVVGGRVTRPTRSDESPTCVVLERRQCSSVVSGRRVPWHQGTCSSTSSSVVRVWRASPVRGYIIRVRAAGTNQEESSAHGSVRRTAAWQCAQ